MKTKSILVYSSYISCCLFALIANADVIGTNNLLEGNNQVFSADADTEKNYIPYQDDDVDDNELQTQVKANSIDINDGLFSKNNALMSSINTKWSTKSKSPTASTKQKNRVVSNEVGVAVGEDIPQETETIIVGDSVMNSVSEEPTTVEPEEFVEEVEIDVSPPVSQYPATTKQLVETDVSAPNTEEIFIKPAVPLAASKEAVQEVNGVNDFYPNDDYVVEDIYSEESIKKDIENIAKSIVKDYLNNPVVTPHITGFTNVEMCSTQTVTQNQTSIVNVTKTVTITPRETPAIFDNETSTVELATPTTIQLRPKIPIGLSEFNKSINRLVEDFDEINTHKKKNSLDVSSKADSLPMDLEALLSSQSLDQSDSLKTTKNEKSGIFGWMTNVKKIFANKNEGSKAREPAVKKKEEITNYFGKRSSLFNPDDVDGKEYTNNDYTLQNYNRYNSMMGAVIAVLAVVLFV